MTTNHSFTNSLIHSFIIVAIASLTLASCNNEEPEPEPEQVPVGAVKGKFTVDEGKQVYFSCGNLQYNTTTLIWRFAEHQWAYRDEGWIDLFGWGTGDDPTKTSDQSSDYPEFSEWGNHPIDNGGNTANQWRSLEAKEWLHLLHGRARADELVALATVNNVHGLIILPDRWTTPQGLTFTPNTQAEGENVNKWVWEASSETVARYIDAGMSDGYSLNIYTAEQWEKMEDKGALFLPAAGFRYGEQISFANRQAHYWNATPRENNNAGQIYFDRCSLEALTRYIRFFGYSVRLVQDVP